MSKRKKSPIEVEHIDSLIKTMNDSDATICFTVKELDESYQSGVFVFRTIDESDSEHDKLVFEHDRMLADAIINQIVDAIKEPSVITPFAMRLATTMIKRIPELENLVIEEFKKMGHIEVVPMGSGGDA